MIQLEAVVEGERNPEERGLRSSLFAVANSYGRPVRQMSQAFVPYRGSVYTQAVTKVIMTTRPQIPYDAPGGNSP